jgi:acyl-CoA synthetase (AMP-forming)/AMP-acid ligase II
MRNDWGSLIGYLATLAGGHVALLCSQENPGAVASLTAIYRPDVMLTSANGELDVTGFRPKTCHDLHPALALLMSTSGSTGSPKLVRLSGANVDSNASAIASALRIRPDDRAMTSLPLHYVYGLSVVNSHLASGAAIVLTEDSVVDESFWTVLAEAGATTFAGVPYTFKLLERIGFDEMEVPSLRYVTQAGGRLAPEDVRRWALVGKEKGWDLVPMYGQSEATSRMATLDPKLTLDYPAAIGKPIPGGTFRIDQVDDLEHGELVYSGPNVMLGYAEDSSDLALGPVLHELRTGDLARRNEVGLYEIVGRRSRFIKIVGLRIDLDDVERMLNADGLTAAATGTDENLIVAVEGNSAATPTSRQISDRLAIPDPAVMVQSVAEIPRLASGKYDYQAIAALAHPRSPSSAIRTLRRRPDASVADIFKEQFGPTEVNGTDTFVGLGGDSLSYVALSVRLEQALGHLPTHWHTTSIDELQQAANTRLSSRQAWRTDMETSVLLRAVAIVLIAGTHVGAFKAAGTAGVLFSVAGFNFARFLLAGERHDRLKRQLRSIIRLVVISVAAIAATAVIQPAYAPVDSVLLIQHFRAHQAGPWSPAWAFWFIEGLVYTLLLSGLLLAVPSIYRLERRFPLGFAVGLLGVGVLIMYGHIPLPFLHLPQGYWRYTIALFAFGWALAQTRHYWQKVALVAVPLATLPAFLGPDRLVAGMIGFTALALVPTVPVPKGLSRLVGLVADASLGIYLIHWLFVPVSGDRAGLPFDNGWVGLAVGVTAGIVYWRTANAVIRMYSTQLRVRLRRDSQRDVDKHKKRRSRHVRADALAGNPSLPSAASSPAWSTPTFGARTRGYRHGADEKARTRSGYLYLWLLFFLLALALYVAARKRRARSFGPTPRRLALGERPTQVNVARIPATSAMGLDRSIPGDHASTGSAL